MNTIGSHPGAIFFRLSAMIILIAILMIVFLSYVDDTERTLERTSILQTKKIIDSSLALVFASYAVNGRLNELNQLDGANPFVFLQEYKILPPGYKGELDTDLSIDVDPGWYYLSHRGVVAYRPYFLDSDRYFSVHLDYEDVDQSGQFERGVDRFKNLYFVRAVEIGN